MILLKDIWKTPNLKKLLSGSEILLYYETDKYAREYIGEGVQLGDVGIDKRLIKSPHYSFVAHSGLDMGTLVSKDTLTPYNPKYYFEGLLKDIDIKETDDMFIFSWMSSRMKNLVLHGMNRAAAYISLLAFVLIQNYVTGIDKCLFIQQGIYQEEEHEYDDLLILKRYGNKLFDDKRLKLESSLSSIKITECSAYFAYQQQLGYMLMPYKNSTKYNYSVKNLEVGDAMLMYKRNKQGYVEHCFPCVIRSMSEKHISFTYYPIVETLLTRKVKLMEVQENVDKTLYSEEDVFVFRGCEVQEEWDNVGVEGYSYNEKYLLIKPIRDDFTVQVFRVSDTQLCKVVCDTVETIYAVFEDRGVDYNKAKFLKEYFGSKIPKYEEARRKGYDQQY